MEDIFDFDARQLFPEIFQDGSQTQQEAGSEASAQGETAEDVQVVDTEPVQVSQPVTHFVRRFEIRGGQSLLIPIPPGNNGSRPIATIIPRTRQQPNVQQSNFPIVIRTGGADSGPQVESPFSNEGNSRAREEVGRPHGRSHQISQGTRRVTNNQGSSSTRGGRSRTRRSRAGRETTTTVIRLPSEPLPRQSVLRSSQRQVVEGQQLLQGESNGSGSSDQSPLNNWPRPPWSTDGSGSGESTDTASETRSDPDRQQSEQDPFKIPEFARQFLRPSNHGEEVFQLTPRQLRSTFALWIHQLGYHAFQHLR